MSFVQSPKVWFGIDSNRLFRSWVNDSTGNVQRQGARGKNIVRVTRGLNHLLGQQPRVYTEANPIRPTYLASSNAYFIYKANVNNEREGFTVKFTAIPAIDENVNYGYFAYRNNDDSQNTGTFHLRANIGASGANRTMNIDFYPEIGVNHGSRSDLYMADRISGENGFRHDGFIVQTKRIDLLDSNIHSCITPDLIRAGEVVTSNAIDKVRQEFHHIRTSALPHHIRWAGESAIGGTTSATCFLSRTTDGRSNHTPGVYIPAQHCGVGKLNVSNVLFRVAGSANPDSHHIVTLNGSNTFTNNWVYVNINSTLPVWYLSDNLQLCTNVNDCSNILENNKIHITYYSNDASKYANIYGITSFQQYP